MIHNPSYNWTWVYNAKHGTNITKLNEKLERSSMRLSCCFGYWFILYLKIKACTTLVLTCFLFSLGGRFLPLAKNWEQGTMFYPMYPKGHFYVLNSLTHKLGQFLKLMPHYKIALQWFSIFHICFEFARFGIG